MSAEASKDRHLTPPQQLIVEWKMKVKDAGLNYLSTALVAWSMREFHSVHSKIFL